MIVTLVLLAFTVGLEGGAIWLLIRLAISQERQIVAHGQIIGDRDKAIEELRSSGFSAKKAEAIYDVVRGAQSD